MQKHIAIMTENNMKLHLEIDAADSGEVARGFRDQVAHGFRFDVAHHSGMKSPTF